MFQRVKEAIMIPERETQVVDDKPQDPQKDTPWYKVSHLRRLTAIILIISLTSTNNGYDGSNFSVLQALDQWQKAFDHPEGQRLGALSNGILFGSMGGVLIAPFLCDKIGRKWVIVIGQTITVLGAVLQGLSSNYGFFLGARIVLGFGSCMASVASPALVSELAHPLYRDTSTFIYNVISYIGSNLSAWITYFSRTIPNNAAWKIPSYLQGALPLLQLSLIWLVPESPRFLISKGKDERAEAILRKHHIGNSTDVAQIEYLNFEVAEIHAALKAERESTKVSYSDFFLKPSFRKRLFLVVYMGFMMQLSGSGLIYYYFSKVLDSIGITDAREQLMINGCLMIFNLVTSASFALVVTRMKRRAMFISSAVGMFVSYLIWTVLSAFNQERNFQDTALAKGVVAMIFVYYLFHNIGLNGLPYLYVTEILPFSHRAKGINLFQTTQMLCLIYNGYVNAIAMEAISWKYYIVYVCLLAVECVLVSLFFPETSGFTLEEVAAVFGDDVGDAASVRFSVVQSEKDSTELIEEISTQGGGKV